ncbi:UNVERIFIED_CONTAM: IST1 protein [Sesamum indicum]
MGKKLNYLLHRSSKTEKLKTLTSLAISRISILKNIYSVRCSQAQSDVVQLLQLGRQEHALLRVEHVIKEEHMLDAFVLVGNYCHILGERTEMIKNSRECPDELKEVISSLIFAASRCGEFPELQEIRAFFTSKFGKDFAMSAVELRNNCGVSPKIIQRLSTRQASLESRWNLLKQLAKHNGITLQLDHAAFISSEKEESEVEQLQMHASNRSHAFNGRKTEITPLHKDWHEATIGRETCPESVKGRQAYRDVAAAAEDAFESAAYAAAAARAAVKLSKLESWNDDSDDDSGFHLQQSDCAWE